MNDKDYLEIQDLYKRFEGLTGTQEADAVLLLALVVKDGLKGIEETLGGIETSLDRLVSIQIWRAKGGKMPDVLLRWASE